MIKPLLRKLGYMPTDTRAAAEITQLQEIIAAKNEVIAARDQQIAALIQAQSNWSKEEIQILLDGQKEGLSPHQYGDRLKKSSSAIRNKLRRLPRDVV